MKSRKKYHTEYYKKNRDRILQQNREYRELHKDEIKAKSPVYRKKYVGEHQEEIKKYQHDYAVKNWKITRKRAMSTPEGRDWIRNYYCHQRKEQRIKVFERLGNKCCRCGFSDTRALQIDHINGGGSTENKKIGSRGIYKRILSLDNPNDKYQLLCANCNWIKRVEQNEIKKRVRETESSQMN